MKHSLKKLSKEKSLDVLPLGLILKTVHFLCNESWQHDSKNLADDSFKERNVIDFFFLSLQFMIYKAFIFSNVYLSTITIALE